MARITTPADLDRAIPAELGPEAANPQYADPAPWTERHPAVLWVALIGALALISVLAIRALKSTRGALDPRQPSS
jgi:hypothetical protein